MRRPPQVVSAFDVPRVYYDPVKKQFFQRQQAPTLQPEARSLVDLYRERLHTLQQRLGRNK